MDTINLKKFAVRSRQVLKNGVAKQLRALGFDADGHIEPYYLPLPMEGGYKWRNNIYDRRYYRKWVQLVHAIQKKGLDYVYEEAAYAWFNRLVAIRILEANELVTTEVLTPVDDIRTPQILLDAQQGDLPHLDDTETEIVDLLLSENNDRPKLFAILINAWCHENPILRGCFGSVADFTELLVPYDIMEKDNFLDMLTHTPYITREDFRNPELIGWLYQFYISEKKDEVFAKKGKFEADDIPAATQIFTPNWIVRYLVQNTVGRIYLDNHPEAGHLTERWSYLTPDSHPKSEAKPIYELKELKKLRMADLACGSGHILNVGFDLYMDLYKEEYYSRPAAVEQILRHNLVGIDIDDRARQLAMFALTLKACQHAPGFEKRFVRPNVMSMPKPYDEELYGDRDKTLHSFFKGLEKEDTMAELNAAYDLLQDAKSLGSVMKIQISNRTRIIITQALEFWESREDIPEEIEMQFMAMRVILALSQSYSAIVMNPPYMGNGNMNQVLSKYVKENYEEGKADLFSVFMQVAENLLQENGKYAMINMQSWMFLSSFEKLRKHIIDTMHIDSLLHLGPRAFDEIGGEVVQNAAFVIAKHHPNNEPGSYYRLIEPRSCQAKHEQYLQNRLTNADGNRIYYGDVPQSNFEKIPGSPIGYWASQTAINNWIDYSTELSKIAEARVGLDTGNNGKYLRLFHEVNLNKIIFNASTASDVDEQLKKYVPTTKGGNFRKWYGNLEYVLKFDSGAYNELLESGNHLPSRNFYFREGICWSRISSSTNISLRYTNPGIVFNSASPTIFCDSNDDLFYILALLISKCTKYYLNIISPTINLQAGEIRNIPLIIHQQSFITNIVKKNISISKLDWDSHETSWDFQANELVTLAATYRDTHPDMENYTPRYNGDFNLFEHCYNQYVQRWTELFHQLHTNEEELNRQFIDIYGLQDELTPDVPLNEVTILQQGEITIENNQLVFHADVIMKQFLSYLVGVCMGRYRLDKPGLHIAHPKPTEEELAPYTYRGMEITIAQEPIIPLLPEEAPFFDNLQHQIVKLVAAIFGQNQREFALQFLQERLGSSLQDYLNKEFWKDHKKMYKNRPIYWLFTSNKGHFRCLTYMHRMNKFTAFKVFKQYLTPYIGHMRNQNIALDAKTEPLTAHERKVYQTNQRNIADCEKYIFRLQAVAEDLERTQFDLDDGFVHNYAKYGDIVAKV